MVVERAAGNISVISFGRRRRRPRGHQRPVAPDARRSGDAGARADSTGGGRAGGGRGRRRARWPAAGGAPPRLTRASASVAVNFTGLVHPPAGHDHAAHDRHRGIRRGRLSATAGERPADGGLSDAERQRQPARCRARDDGRHRGDAAREGVLRDRRRRRDHLEQQPRLAATSRCSSRSTATSSRRRRTSTPRSRRRCRSCRRRSCRRRTTSRIRRWRRSCSSR